ncbi:MAG: LuxR C-terminal-related transcriptional regulator [Bacteroides sp.]|nr:LuxR C-terminal-related transcriptional regulator [Bacteroides sp.]
MKNLFPTPEQMWARQHISGCDVNNRLWAEKKKMLQQWAFRSPECMFAVDVYRCRYDFASDRFSDLLGYPLSRIRNIRKQGDFLQDQIHGDDRSRLAELQVGHSEFIYSLAPRERNEYTTHYQYRIRHAAGKYISVVSRQWVMQQDRNGKAWMIGGSLDIAPDQSMEEGVRYAVRNLRTGQIVSSSAHAPVSHQTFPADRHPASDSIRLSDPLFTDNTPLTPREIEILRLIQYGLLSKEIADRLNISIYTVHNHRKNILSKLGADRAIEAIRFAREKGLI